MSRRKIDADSTNVAIPVATQDYTRSDGGGVVGLLYTTPGLVCEYRREGQATRTAITLVNTTLGAWLSGGFIKDGDDGDYELSAPDACFAAAGGARWVAIWIRGVSGLVTWKTEFELDRVKYQNATNFGLANLDLPISAVNTAVTSIQNNTRCVRVVPDVIERPDSGTTTYRVELLLYDDVGNMEVPDAAPTVALVNQAGTDLSARLDSPTMTLVSPGRYRSVYTASVGDALEQLVWTFSVVEGGATRLYGNTSTVLDTSAVGFNSGDRTTLNAAAAEITRWGGMLASGTVQDTGASATSFIVTFTGGTVPSSDTIAGQWLCFTASPLFPDKGQVLTYTVLTGSTARVTFASGTFPAAPANGAPFVVL
jgi:hypothetical protein